MNADCPDCRAAAARPRIYGVYRMGCLSCTARSIARSHQAADANASGDSRELRELVCAVMPVLPVDDAMLMVRRWWRIDHPRRGQPAEGEQP